MGEVIDPRNASIDGLIDWLREKRVRQPASPLADLLGSHKFAADRLIDLACIDLMQRRRMGHAVSVETYLNEFPALNRAQHRLDLIDAELCVTSELGEPTDIAEIIRRFPDLADPIRELVQLDGVPSSTLPPLPAARVDDTCESAADLSKSDSLEFSVSSEASKTEAVHPAPHYPVDAPEWFAGDQCVASGPGHWLIRGRDSTRGDALAMKIIELPAQISNQQGEQILDACEQTAKVRNSTWIVPSVAAIQQRHLAVIRPWVFAPNRDVGDPSADPATQLRDFASIAFAIQSAHDVGAAHGAIHARNLIRDHQGKTKIVDAVSGLGVVRRWIVPGDHTASDQLIANDRRQQLDAQDLIKLVAAASIEWDPAMTGGLINDLRSVVDQFSGEASGRIGELLIKRADSGGMEMASPTNQGQRLTWRKRFALWFAGE